MKSHIPCKKKVHLTSHLKDRLILRDLSNKFQNFHYSQIYDLPKNGEIAEMGHFVWEVFNENDFFEEKKK